MESRGSALLWRQYRRCGARVGDRRLLPAARVRYAHGHVGRCVPSTPRRGTGAADGDADAGSTDAAGKARSGLTSAPVGRHARMHFRDSPRWAPEVVWTRVLSLLLGGTVYTFSMIAAAFLAGLGIGSTGTWVARQSRRPDIALAVCQIGVMVAVMGRCADEPAFPYWPHRSGPRTDRGSTFRSICFGWSLPSCRRPASGAPAFRCTGGHRPWKQIPRASSRACMPQIRSAPSWVR